MSSRTAVLRGELVETLRGITTAIEESALQRCPYRAVDDVCTHHMSCINQRRTAQSAFCSGAELNVRAP